MLHYFSYHCFQVPFLIFSFQYLAFWFLYKSSIFHCYIRSVLIHQQQLLLHYFPYHFLSPTLVCFFNIILSPHISRAFSWLYISAPFVCDWLAFFSLGDPQASPANHRPPSWSDPRRVHKGAELLGHLNAMVKWLASAARHHHHIQSRRMFGPIGICTQGDTTAADHSWRRRSRRLG